MPPGFPGGDPSPLPGSDDGEELIPAPDPPAAEASAAPRAWRFGRRRDKAAPFEPPLLQTSYDDETVQDVIEVSCVEVVPPRALDAGEQPAVVEDEPVEDEPEADPEPFEIDLTDAPSDTEPDEDREEIDLTGRESKRTRRPRLSLVWPGDTDRSVPPDFPGLHGSSDTGSAGSVGLQVTGRRTVVQPRGLRAVVAAVYAALADPLTGGDDAAREQRAQRVRKAGIVAGSTVLSAVLVYTIFPVRTYLDQRSATQRAREEIEVLSEANEKLAERAEDLRTPEVVEEKARADYGYVFPNEESYRVLPPPVVTTVPPTTTTIPPLP